MNPFAHGWDVTPSAAIALQSELAQAVVRHDACGIIARVAGVDVAYDGDRAFAAVALFDAVSLDMVELVVAERAVRVPYIPHLFSFRELPVVLDAMEKLDARPDLIVCDGQGIAHPRRFGLASHLGVLVDLPTIGCAKTRLIGTHDDPGPARGSRSPLIDAGETVGAVLRTQGGVKPLYVSIGHRIGLDSACDWVLRLSPRYRLPETTRAADHAVRLALRARTTTAGDLPR